MRRIPRAPPVAGLLCVVAACQPSSLLPPDLPCESARPEPGVIAVGLLGCDAQIPPGGEGHTQADLWLATYAWRAVVRHPQDALTAPGLGGGTLTDLAPWPGSDTVHEIVPIVGGGWLVDVALENEDDGFTVTGVVAPLPDRPATAVGETRTVRYRADPDRPFLTVEGAEGFWVNPLGDEVLYEGFARTPSRMVGGVGQIVDHGGTFEILGTDRLLVGQDAELWEEIAGDDGQLLGGTVLGAEELVLFRGERPVGRIPIAGPDFGLWIPSDIDGVRAEASGRAPSAILPPSARTLLALGTAGSVSFVPTWEDGRPHWFSASWTSPDGRSGRATFPPDGGVLPLGSGVYEVVLSAGPAFEDLALHLELRPDDARTLPVRLPMRIDPGDYVLAGFRRPSDRSRTWRGSDATAGREAAADGLSYVTFTPTDDLAGVGGAVPEFPSIAFRNGVVRAGDGYSVAAWPWSSNGRKAMHGAPLVPPRSALDEAAAMSGGVGSARRTLSVDLGWLALAGPPRAVLPNQVWLDGPVPGPDDADLASWEPWFAWLDAGRPLVPTGPWTWVRVEDPLRMGTADIEQSLARGDVCAGTGPRIALRVDGMPPGETLAPGNARRLIVGTDGFEDIDHLALVTSDGVDPLPVVPLQELLRPLAGRWVLVAAWSSDPEGSWAVTGPVWLSAP